MAVRQYKPTSAGRRSQSVSGFQDITKTIKHPERSLLAPLHKHGGRNNRGRLTMRHRGGGHKRRYRKIDFRRNKDGIPAKVAAIEYDPNRSANIALLHYRDGEKRYIIAPNGLRVGVEIVSGAEVMPDIGNTLPLSRIPLGTVVHAVEMKVGKGAQLVRSNCQPFRHICSGCPSASEVRGSRNSDPHRLTIRRRSICHPESAQP